MQATLNALFAATDWLSSLPREQVAYFTGPVLLLAAVLAKVAGLVLRGLWRALRDAAAAVRAS